MTCDLKNHRLLFFITCNFFYTKTVLSLPLSLQLHLLQSLQILILTKFNQDIGEQLMDYCFFQAFTTRLILVSYSIFL
jgi:hypothetical protein